MPQSLINAQGSGVRVPDDVVVELERRLAPVLLEESASAVSGKEWYYVPYDPAGVADERERATRAICIRRGQPSF